MESFLVAEGSIGNEEGRKMVKEMVMLVVVLVVVEEEEVVG